MKPKKIFEARQHRLAIREHQLVLNGLREEDPGAPPQSEALAPTERYDQMADYIKSILRPDSVARDDIGRIGHGTTPAVWVELTEAGDTGEEQVKLMLSFYYQEKTDYTDACLRAIWTDPSVSKADFQHEEFLKRDEIAAGQLNPLLHRRLNNLEWSFRTYQEIAASLPPDYAAQIGFPAAE